MKFFKQRSAKLHNGQKVRVGDTVSFINSDGEKCTGKIEYDINNPKRLFFWNNAYEIEDYHNAVLERMK